MGLLRQSNSRNLSFELPNACKTEFVDKHIYFDLNRCATVSIETVNSKVLVLPTHFSFKNIIQTNWSNEYEDVFYGRFAYDQRFNGPDNAPFLELSDALKFVPPKPAKICKLTIDNLRKHDNSFRRSNLNSDIRNVAANKTKKKRMDKKKEKVRIPKKSCLKKKKCPLSVKNINNQQKKRKLEETKANANEHKPLKKKRKTKQTIEIFTDSSDSSDSSDDIPIISKRVKPLPKKKKKKIKEANSKKRGPKEVQTLDGEMDEMKKICNRLNIGKPPKTGVGLYNFSSHLAVYKAIDKAFKKYDNTTFRVFIFKQKQSFCRDFKSHLYAKSSVTPLATLQQNIANRFKELKPNYNAQ